MHVLDKRVYTGSPSELATVDTTERDGGAVTLRLDGVIVPEDTAFRLGPKSGDERVLEILLAGATGAFCVVSVTEVDGGADGDLLMCQLSDPFPRHVYRFITAPTGAIAAIAATRSLAPAASRSRGATKKKATPKRKRARKGGGK